MKSPERIQFLAALRCERLAGVWLAVIALLVLFLQPLAEANAADKPFAAEICTTYGQAGKAAIPGLADDCGACIAGHWSPASLIPSGDLSSAVIHPFPVSGPADFLSPLTRTDAAVIRWMKPPAHGPPSFV